MAAATPAKEQGAYVRFPQRLGIPAAAARPRRQQRDGELQPDQLRVAVRRPASSLQKSASPPVGRGKRNSGKYERTA
jgi:hypothetical protein